RVGRAAAATAPTATPRPGRLSGRRGIRIAGACLRRTGRLRHRGLLLRLGGGAGAARALPRPTLGGRLRPRAALPLAPEVLGLLRREPGAGPLRQRQPAGGVP